MRKRSKIVSQAEARLAALERERESEVSDFHWARIRTDSVKELLALAWAAKLAGNDDINPAHLSAEARADFLANQTSEADPFNPLERSRPETTAERQARWQRSHREYQALLYWRERREVARHV